MHEAFCEWSIQGVRYLDPGPAQYGERRRRRRTNAAGGIIVEKAGAIDYYCRLHPNMKGSIAVTRLKAIGFSGRKRSQI